jgi:hypothetical protein
MSRDLDLRLRLTATNKGVAGTVRNTSKEVDRYSDTVENASRSTRRASQATGGFTTAGQEATRMFRLQKGSLQQAGYQFQDLAVQIGSGTSAFVALGQQGPQLASLLGPGGAVMGAVIAIGSAVGGYLYRVLGDTTEQIDALSDTVDGLSEKLTTAKDGTILFADEMRELASVSREAARIELIVDAQRAKSAAVEAANTVIETFESIAGENPLLPDTIYSDRIGDISETLKISRQDAEALAEALPRTVDRSQEAYQGLLGVVADLSEQYGASSPQVLKLAESLGISSVTAIKALRAEQDLKEALDNTQRTIENSSEDIRDRQEALGELIGTLEEDYLALSLNDELLLQHRLSVAGASEEERQRALALFGNIQALREKAEAEDEAAKAAADAAREEKRATQELERRTQALLDQADPLAKFARDWQTVQSALSEGIIDEGQAQQIMDNLADAGEDPAKKAAKEFENQFASAADSVSRSLQDAIASGDWDTLGEGIGNAIAVSASAIVSDQITKSLSEGLTAESGLLSQAGAAFAGPLAGALVGGAIQLAVRELGDYFSDDWDPTAARQASQGTGTVLGSIEAKSQSIARSVDVSASASEQLVGINTGMLRALQSVQAGISGATARVALGVGGVSIAGPSVQSGSEVFGPAAGALVGRIFGPASSLVGGALENFGEFIFDTASDTLDFLTFGELNLDELLGGKSKKRDEGIQIVGGYLSDLIDETLVNAYATFRVKKHAFDDYDTKERMERLGGDVEQQFALAFGSIYDSVEQAAAALGIDAEQRLANFQVDTQRLSLEGLNAEEQQAEIAAYFGTVFDGLAGEVAPFLEDFQEAGEGLGETLARVATFTQVTQEAVNRLGVEFQDLTGRALVEASERLVEAAGGVDQFISSMQGFISNFASEAEQFALAQSDVTRALAQNNLSLPDTREAYYELLQAQDASTEAGAQNVATLLRIQSAADAYYTYLEDQQEQAARQQERLADMQRRRNREIIQEQQQIVSGRLSEARAAAGIVQSALSGLTVGTASASEFARTSATARLQDIVATGAVPGTEDLRSLVNSATDIDMSQFATMADYAAEVGRTGGLLGDLDQITREQVTVEQRMLDSLERQVELLESGNQEQIQALVALQTSVEKNTAAPARAQATAPAMSVSSGSLESGDNVLRSVLDRIEKVNSSQVAIARHTQRTSRILERLERYGIEVRE